MDSFKETQRQIRFAVGGLLIISALGTAGFMVFEGKSFLDALWLTIITLTTVGYGDDFATSQNGRIFTIFLIFTGFGVVAFGLQAIATILISPEIRELRDRRRTEKIIRSLERHYIICGGGEIVDQTIAYLLQSVRMRLAFYDDEIYGPIDTFLDNIFGDDDHGHYPKTRAFVRRIYLALTRPFQRVGTLLDIIVVVTEDQDYARSLREEGFLAVHGSPTREEVLQAAGAARATAMVVMLPDDTEALLTVLTGRTLNSNLYITAATIEQELADKTLRVGANNVVLPYDLAGQYLNNVTLRPTVYDFFYGILFDHSLNIQTTQVTLERGSPWIGKRLKEVNLEAQNAHVLGIYQPKAEEFVVAPSDTFILSESETVIIAAPTHAIAPIQAEALEGVKTRPTLQWQRARQHRELKRGARTYSLEEAQTAIADMSKHFVVCGNDQVIRNATEQLDPDRPFVIVSNDQETTDHLIERGFRVVHGDHTHDKTLEAAGVRRALAIMISLEDEADTVLTVLTARALSKHILITATAISEEHARKINHAGADRVMDPFSIAAQFVLLSTTRPLVSQFFQSVLYNPDLGLETTELYMGNTCPWIGQTIADLRLSRLFRAHVIGVRHVDGTFAYAPPTNYEIRENEVLIIVTPMVNADELRATAHGSATKRPETLRNTSAVPTTVRRNPLLDL